MSSPLFRRAFNGGWFDLDPAFACHGLQPEISKVRNDKNWKELPEVPEKNQFALEIDHMSGCVLYNREPYTPGEEGLQGHCLIEAIYHPAKERKVVTLEGIKS